MTVSCCFFYKNIFPVLASTHVDSIILCLNEVFFFINKTEYDNMCRVGGLGQRLKLMEIHTVSLIHLNLRRTNISVLLLMLMLMMKSYLSTFSLPHTRGTRTCIVFGSVRDYD